MSRLTKRYSFPMSPLTINKHMPADSNPPPLPTQENAFTPLDITAPVINSRVVPAAVCIPVETLEKFTSPLTESNLKYHTTAQVIALEEQLRRETEEEAQKLKPADDLGLDSELVPHALSEYNSRNASNFSLPSPPRLPFPNDAVPPLPTSPLSGAFMTTEEVIQKRRRSKFRDFITKLTLTFKPLANDARHKRNSHQHASVHSVLLSAEEKHRRHRSLPIFTSLSQPASPATHTPPLSPSSSVPPTQRTPSIPTTTNIKKKRDSSLSLIQQHQSQQSSKTHPQRLSLNSSASSDHAQSPVLREKRNSISSLSLSFIQRKSMQTIRTVPTKEKDFIAYRYPKMVPTIPPATSDQQDVQETTDYFADLHLSIDSDVGPITPPPTVPNFHHHLTTAYFSEPEQEDPACEELDHVPQDFPLPSQSRLHRTVPEASTSRASVISESTRRRYSDSLAGLPVPPFPIGREPPPVTVADSPPAVSFMDLGLGVKPREELSFGVAYGIGAEYVAV
ncbi:hypothetical protein BC938DRAFT_475374 [Jimgerdemannia flammicorona]|uniref:Uncharacterized protein n=1 Tax=Jimgerdemannia flammicorona TaxID=994334 RepID=A0A433PVQ3_9FUNG|nr:hypothetical protein BC938DRAFT_475374 [Jimgerdemannia flammicorona]